MITIIAAIGRNNELGFRNKLLWHIPEDLQHFRKTTLDKTILMGSTTFEGMGCKLLPNRRTVLVTRTPEKYPGIETINCVSRECIMSLDADVFVVGGQQIYTQTMPIADKLIITHIDYVFPDADTFFPVIGEQWLINNSRTIHTASYGMKIVEYVST